MAPMIAGAPAELNEALDRFLADVVRGRPWQVRAQSPEEVQVVVFAVPIGQQRPEVWRVPTEGEPEMVAEGARRLTLELGADELADLRAEYADHARDADEDGVPCHPSQRAVWEALISHDLMERDERDQFEEEAPG